MFSTKIVFSEGSVLPEIQDDGAPSPVCTDCSQQMRDMADHYEAEEEMDKKIILMLLCFMGITVVGIALYGIGTMLPIFHP